MKTMLKRFMLVLLAFMLIACNGQQGTEKGKDTLLKEATVEVFGYNKDKPIKLKVAVSEDKIESIEVLDQAETESIGGAASKRLAKEIVDKQSLEIDAVSGATLTSKAMMEGVNQALDNLGFDKTKLQGKSAAKDGEQKTMDVDVLVIGAGGAGLSAAIEAADAGKKVAVLEKTALTGGNTNRATGGMNAAGTPVQDKNEFTEAAGVEKKIQTAKEKYPELKELIATVEKQFADYQAKPEGYFDTVELFMLDTLVGGRNLNNHDLVRVFASNAAQSVEWLKTIGADLSEAGFAGGASVKRIHKPVNAEGKTIAVGSYLIPILTKVAEDKGVQLIYETPATKLLVENNKVVGVEAKGYKINAKAVVLATGGFGANLDMVAELKPELKGFVTTNSPAITGDGIKMAQEIGADVVDLDQIQIHPTVEQKTASLITEGLRGDGAILFNQDGKRFIDETSTRDVVSAAEIAQPGGYAYLLVDQAMTDASSVIAGYISKGFTTSGDTIEDLAKALEVDPATLKMTLDTWNKAVENHKDDQFNRTSFTNPLAKGPYYAIKVSPGIHHTMGGLRINVNSEVLNKDGKVIEGLYAAGEVTGGVHGANRLGGNAVTDIIVYGRIAGQNAAKYAK